MENFEFTLQYGDNEPLELDTSMIEEYVLRIRCGLEHREKGIYNESN